VGAVQPSLSERARQLFLRAARPYDGVRAKEQAMSDDGEHRYLRAREVLRDAGWCFDEFVAAETRKWLASNPADAEAREEIYRRARVATELKLLLMGEVEEYEGNKLIKESRYGRNQQSNA
jgi:hypothetical protein